MSTPPTIHDSDRRALKEIEQSCLCLEGAPGYESPFLDIEAAALIIARHHAEERAAMEKVREYLESIYNYTEKYNSCAWSRILAEKALTALRTASQSPTK